MSDQTTPETNALYAQLLAENPGNLIYLEEMLELARKLEQERDEAREEIQRLRYDSQKEAEHHDRMVKELEGLYDKLKS
jgi:DNA-binding protein H-NS